VLRDALQNTPKGLRRPFVDIDAVHRKKRNEAPDRPRPSDLLFPKPSVQKTKLSSPGIWLTLRRIEA